MSFVRTNPLNFRHYAQFLQTNEALSMKISVQLRHYENWKFPPNEDISLYHIRDKGKTEVILLIDRFKQIYLSGVRNLTSTEFDTFLTIIRNELESCELLTTTPPLLNEQQILLQRKKLDFNIEEYDIMKYSPNEKPLPTTNHQLQFKMNEENDLEQIKSLHCAYLLEEVSNNRRPITADKASKIALRLLKGQCIIGCYENDRLICKANSNSIGLNTIQLGGVYTILPMRGNHIATFTISNICNKLYKEGWEISLFVKKVNFPAIKAYLHCGFKTVSKMDLYYR